MQLYQLFVSLLCLTCEPNHADLQQVQGQIQISIEYFLSDSEDTVQLN
jgi:hypothetical protein